MLSGRSLTTRTLMERSTGKRDTFSVRRQRFS